VNWIEREEGIGVGFICKLGKVGGLFAKASTRRAPPRVGHLRARALPGGPLFAHARGGHAHVGPSGPRCPFLFLAN
jgi:hypothetical protein